MAIRVPGGRPLQCLFQDLVLMIFMAKLNYFLPTYWILILAEDLKPTIN